MILTVPNWDIYSCILRGIYSKHSPSLAGMTTTIPPLDYILGDILSLNFVPEQNGKIHPLRDNAWLRAVHCSQSYYDIAENAVDDEHSDTILALLDRFFSFPEEHMSFANFEWFLAVAKLSDPQPDKSVVPKGFYSTGIESSEAIAARDKLIDSIGANDSTAFFDVLKKSKDLIDLHCHFDILGFADLALTAAYLVLKSGKTLKRCAHCGCLFSPSRTGEIYCNRPSPENKKQSCKEAAKYEKQLARERASESGKIYKSVSTMLAAKIDYAKTSEDECKRRSELLKFREDAKRWREQIKQGSAKESEYITFLNSFKKRKPK